MVLTETLHQRKKFGGAHEKLIWLKIAKWKFNQTLRNSNSIKYWTFWNNKDINWIKVFNRLAISQLPKVIMINNEQKFLWSMDFDKIRIL